MFVQHVLPTCPFKRIMSNLTVQIKLYIFCKVFDLSEFLKNLVTKIFQNQTNGDKSKVMQEYFSACQSMKKAVSRYLENVFKNRL